MEAEGRPFVSLLSVPHLCGRVKDLLSQEWDMSAVGLDLSQEEPVHDLRLPLMLLFIANANAKTPADGGGQDQILAHACLEAFDAEHEELRDEAKIEDGGVVAKGLLTLLIVDRQHRAQGLGRRMVEELARLAATSFGMSNLYLTCEQDKRGFYERCGFCFITTAHEVEKGQHLLWMKRPLSTRPHEK
jgi:GNAT superfamily N-acetyltransferase